MGCSSSFPIRVNRPLAKSLVDSLSAVVAKALGELAAVPVLHVLPHELSHGRVHRLEPLEAVRRYLDGVPLLREDREVEPRLALGLVVDEVRLPVPVLDDDPRAPEVELLDLHGDPAARVRLLDGDVVVPLAVVHVHHPRLGHDAPDCDVLRLPLDRRARREHFPRVVLDLVLTLADRKLQVRGDVAPQRHWPARLADRVGAPLRLADVAPVDLKDDVADVDAGVERRRVGGDVGHDGTVPEARDDVGRDAREEVVRQVRGGVEHGPESASGDARLVVLPSGGEAEGVVELEVGDVGHPGLVAGGVRAGGRRGGRLGGERGLVMGQLGRVRRGGLAEARGSATWAGAAGAGA
mmetsp:Transcript_1890/g.4407  ORF Transcript_1890/g.4407 Transcript_1890/m.4407 type:complete len:352 (-) Transcript_1890:455-1510(-)